MNDPNNSVYIISKQAPIFMEIIPVTVNFEDFAGFVDDGIVIFATVVAYMKLPQSSKDVIAGYPDVRIGDAREYGAC